MHLIENSSDAYDYYALSDQDDVWDNDKLFNAIKLIKSKESGKSSFYFSNLKIVDENLNFMTKSDINFDISFVSSLIKNPATGCTIVFDRAFKKEILKVSPEYMIMHDWWLYCCAAAINCNIIYDRNSYINYRQHHNNVLGFEKGIKKMKLRIKRFLHSDNSRLRQCTELLKLSTLSKEEKGVLDLFINYKNSRKVKMKLLLNKNITTNNFITDLLFKLSIIFNKF